MPRKDQRRTIKRPYKSYSDEDLINALAELADTESSIREIARKYNIPHQTLANKVCLTFCITLICEDLFELSNFKG